MAYTIGIDARKLADFGIGTYVRNLIAALARLDTENRYVLFCGRTTPEALPENFRVVTERAPVYSVREQFALSWKLFRLDLDVYHATHYVLPAIVPCRAVVTIHDIIHLLFPEFLPNRLAYLYAQGMIRRSLTRGARIIAVSHNTKSDLMEAFRVSGRKIRVIYNGVEDVYRDTLPPMVLQNQLAALGLHQPYLLFVGNPKPHKNVANVLRAYGRAVAGLADPPDLVCVGASNEQEFKLRQLAAQLGVGGRLRLLGHLPQASLPAVYQGAILFLYPTLYEGFGLPVLEAMASGTPVITSNNSALREIAEGYAELVPPLDVEQMANAILRCLTDPAHRADLAAKGRVRAQDFRWDRAAERTLDVYKSAISSRLPAGTDGNLRITGSIARAKARGASQE